MFPIKEESSSLRSSKKTEAFKSKPSGKSSILNNTLLLPKLLTSTNNLSIGGTSLLKSSRLISNLVPSPSGSHNLIPIFGEIPLTYAFIFIPPSSDISSVIPSVQ